MELISSKFVQAVLSNVVLHMHTSLWSPFWSAPLKLLHFALNANKHFLYQFQIKSPSFLNKSSTAKKECVVENLPTCKVQMLTWNVATSIFCQVQFVWNVIVFIILILSIEVNFNWMFLVKNKNMLQSSGIVVRLISHLCVPLVLYLGVAEFQYLHHPVVKVLKICPPAQPQYGYIVFLH